VAGVLWYLYPSRQLTVQQQADKNVVEIFFMGPGGPISGSMEDLVREFEQRSQNAHRKDPSRPIYRVISGQNAARNQVEDPTRFLVAVAGGTPPDVIFFDRYAVAEWAARGGFQPLDQYIQRDLADIASGHRKDIAREEVPTPERFYAPCWDEGQYDGRIYGIPNSVDNRALFYNEDLLIAKGFKEVGPDGKVRARPPTTWADLETYAVELTQPPPKDKERIKVIGFPAYYGNSWLYMYGWMNGAEFMSPDRKQCRLAEPAVVEALEFLKHIYDLQGGYTAVKAFEAGFQGNELDPFIQGKVAMKIDGVWVLPNIAAYGRDLNFGVAPNPMPQKRMDQLKAEGKPAAISWCGGWAYAIPSTARNKDAAWELIRFLTADHAFRVTAENDRVLAESMGRLYLPNQCPVKAINEEFFAKYVLGNERLPQRFKDGYKVFNDLLPVSKFRPVTPVGQLLWNKHRDAAEEVLEGTAKTPKEVLEYHAAIVQRSLDKILNPPPGKPIRDWTWFYVAYGAGLLILGSLVVLWDTKQGFRSRLGKLMGMSREKSEAIIEGSRGGYFRQQWFGGILCASPWIIGFIVMAGGPMVFSLVMSFCDFDVINPAKLTGLANYRDMVGQDELFWKALGNTAFMLIGVPLGMIVSLLMAMLLNLKVRGIAVWRTFFYLPAIVPMVAGSILWIWIFNPEGGFLNQVLELFGVRGPLWLGDQNWAKPSIILMGLWGAGGGMIIWLAGLKGISEQLYEAADVDGANGWQKFLHVTIPQLTPYIFFNLIMGIIGTFQIFGQAFIMTQGGPANSTLFYVYHLFNNAFRYGHMGYAAAMAWFLFVIVFLLTLVQMKLSKRWVYYESE
jgi:multiple sugar transport system permease protein